MTTAYLPALPEVIELDMEAINAIPAPAPIVTPEDDPFMFEFGWLDEFQMRAEVNTLRENVKMKQARWLRKFD